MRYRDTITIYSPITSRYNQNPSANINDAHMALCIIEENSGLNRNGYYDSISGDAHLYLPASDQYAKSINYELAGYFIKFGSTMYRVLSVATGKAALTSNRVRHIELALEKVSKDIA